MLETIETCPRSRPSAEHVPSKIIETVLACYIVRGRWIGDIYPENSFSSVEAVYRGHQMRTS
jgi:hypothetical protein